MVGTVETLGMLIVCVSFFGVMLGCLLSAIRAVWADITDDGEDGDV